MENQEINREDQKVEKIETEEGTGGSVAEAAREVGEHLDEDDIQAIERNQDKEREKAGINKKKEQEEFNRYVKESIRNSKRLIGGKFLIPYATAYYSRRGVSPTEVTKFLNSLDRGKLGGYGKFLDLAGVKTGEVQETTETDKSVFQNMLLGIAVVDELEKLLWNTLTSTETVRTDIEGIKAAGIGSLPYWDIEMINTGSKKGTKRRMEIAGIMDETVSTESELMRRIWEYSKELKAEEKEVEEKEGLSEIQQNMRDVEGSAQIPFAVNGDVNEIIKRLDNIYGTVKKGDFAGIVTKEGGQVKLYDIKQKERLQHHNEYILTLFNAYEKEVLDKIEGAIGSIGDDTFKLDKKYSPGWHLNNLKTNSKGQTYWELSIREQFRGFCGELLNAEYEKTALKNNRPAYTEYVTDITARVTNVVLMRQVNRNTMLYRIMGINRDDTEQFRSVFDKEISKYLANRDNLGIGACRTALDNVTYLSIIYDLKHFEDEMLFGYKRIENLDNYIPDVNNVVLGIGLDGEPVTVDLMSEAGKMTQILAGSRSGKGVMTMSFMSTIQATGGSIVYMDYKPDIGAMLWQLEDIIKRDEDIDVKFLSMDAMSDVSTFNGARPKRYEANKFREGIPTMCINDLPDDNAWKSVRLMKLVILTDLLGDYQKKHPNAQRGDIFLIIDEIKLLSKPLAKIEEYMNKRMVAADREANPDVHEYKIKLQNVFSDSIKSITEGVEANWAPLGVRVIMIGQVYDKGWGQSTLSSSLIHGVKRTIAGKGQVSKANTVLEDTEYELIGAGSDTNKGRGMFIVTDSKIGPPQKSGNLQAMGIPTLTEDMVVKTPEFFKSYFTIIDNDLDVEEYEAQKAAGTLASYWGSTGTKFTTELLKYAGPVNSEKYQKAEADLYNAQTGQLNPSVSYKGLLDVVVDKANLDKAEFYQNLNNGYARYESMFEEIKQYLPYEYDHIEEYIADLRPGSLNTKMELQSMIEGTAPIPNRNAESNEGGGGFTGDVDIFADIENDFDSGNNEETEEQEIEMGVEDFDEGYESAYPEEEEYLEEEDIMPDWGTEGAETETPPKPKQESKNKPGPQMGYQSEPETKETKTRTEKANNPERGTSDSRLLESRIVVADSKNPFLLYPGYGNIATVNKKIEMSKIILDDLAGQMGGLSNITEFRINGDKSISVNGVGYKPSFDLDFLKTVAPYQREELRAGQVGGIIYFKHVLMEMPGLTTIEIEPKDIGESSALKEIGYRYVSDYKKLFNKMRYLTRIVICGEIITPDTEIEGETEHEGFNLGSKIANMFNFGGKKDKTGTTRNPNPLGEQMLDSVINSPPAKIIGGALGWTVGVKATIWMATALGPFGLLFGALAMGGAYQESKKRRN